MWRERRGEFERRVREGVRRSLGLPVEGEGKKEEGK